MRRTRQRGYTVASIPIPGGRSLRPVKNTAGGVLLKV